MTAVHLPEKRILLCSAAPENALRLLDVPGLSVCAVACCPQQISPLITTLQPHVVLFFDKLTSAACQYINEIAALSPLSPPRLVCRTDESASADAVFDPRQPEALPAQILTACAAPVGLLALPTLNKRKALAESLLRRLGMPDHLLGFRSTALGAAWLSAAPYPHPPARHWLYPLLAEECSVSPAAIERRIRSAIEYTWLYGDLSTQSMLFGFTVSAERGKPTNAEFLSLLSEHIRRQLLLPAQ